MEKPHTINYWYFSKMKLDFIPPSLAILPNAISLTTSEKLEGDSDLTFTDPKNNNITNWTETEDIVGKKFLVYKINLFLVTLPCLLLFLFVFASYVSILQQLKLHG